VIFDWNYAPWICKTDACDTTNPETPNQTAWKAFDLTSMQANKADWSAYDINLFNYEDAPESPYENFNEGVICKAPSVEPLSFGDRVCDANTANTPHKVRVCNKTSCTKANGSYSYLPRTREVGWVDGITIAAYKIAKSVDYFAYAANTKFSSGSIVRDNSAAAPAYY